MKATALVALCFGVSAAASAAGQPSATCPSGPTVQWIADYCMARIGTDDEIAASDCINEQSKIVFRSTCAANLHFKRALCEVVVKSGARAGTVGGCVNDPGFVGPTVKKGGVGAGQSATADGLVSLASAPRE